MELRQLKYFIRAAELQNFTDAANELYITQSTLSQQIKQLENTLGVLLFDRLGKRIRLTEAGNLFLPHAYKTVLQATEGQQVLNDLIDLKTGVLNIGSTYGLSALLVKALPIFRSMYPQVVVNIIFGATNELLQKLDKGTVDCMLSFMETNDDGQLEIHRLFTAHLSLIMHESHPMADYKKIKLTEIKGLTLALPSAGFSIRQLFDKVVAEAGVQLNIDIEVNDINTLLQLADTKNWCTVLMNSSLFGFPSLRAIPISHADFKRHATILFSAKYYRKHALTAFNKILKDCAKEFNPK